MKKNRLTGHQAERDWIDILSNRFGLTRFRAKKPDGSKVTESEANIGTARQFSRNLDGRGIDVWIKPGSWISNFWFQIKKTVVRGKSNSIDVGALFTMMPPIEGIRALVTRIKRKKAKNEVHENWVVTLLPEDFFTLMDSYRIACRYQELLDELFQGDHLWDYEQHTAEEAGQATQDLTDRITALMSEFEKIKK